MLMNFSFLLICFTYRFGLPAERVWVSVYEDDDEAFEIWHDEVSPTRVLC